MIKEYFLILYSTYVHFFQLKSCRGKKIIRWNEEMVESHGCNASNAAGWSINSFVLPNFNATGGNELWLKSPDGTY